jgi:hypothetical protein
VALASVGPAVSSAGGAAVGWVSPGPALFPKPTTSGRHAARGNRPGAAEYYRQAADFVPAHADQYGPNMATSFRKRVAESEAPKE